MGTKKKIREWFLAPRQDDHGETSVIQDKEAMIIAIIPSPVWNSKLTGVVGNNNIDDDRANARLIIAAPALAHIIRPGLDAARRVRDSWEKGDLAGSVRALAAWETFARGVLEDAKPSRRKKTSTRITSDLYQRISTAEARTRIGRIRRSLAKSE